RRRHTRFSRDWSSDVCSSDLDEKDNLILKAYHLLKKDFNDLPPIAVHLHKAIPVGAGLGGGSADGAFALRLMNKLFDLHLENWFLEDYAAQLGSDCPFFRSEEHTSELQSRENIVCRLLPEKKN